MMDLVALIPCAGIGERYGEDLPKQYTLIGGKTVLEHTLTPFIQCEQIQKIILVAKPTDNIIDQYQKLSSKIAIKKVGGTIRAESVRNGLEAIACEDNAWVLVHDAARCCLSLQLLEKLITEVVKSECGGLLAYRATDTVKYAKKNGDLAVERTILREHVYLAQTPQMFRYNTLLEALSLGNLSQITDESSAIEQLGQKVQIVESCSSNIKITYPIDKYIAEVILKQQQ